MDEGGREGDEKSLQTKRAFGGRLRLEKIEGESAAGNERDLLTAL